MKSQYCDEPMMMDLRFHNMKGCKIFSFCLIVAMMLKITVDSGLKQGYICVPVSFCFCRHAHLKIEVAILGFFKCLWSYVVHGAFMHYLKMCNAVYELVRVSCHAYMGISR